MNSLPEAWHKLLDSRPLHASVLVDGAMLRNVGAHLARAPGTAISLFADLPTEAQALGPWLLPTAEAMEHGVDGTRPGVNWLASTATLLDNAEHLRRWMRDGDPNGMHYTRLADGRVLRAAMTVWSPAQQAAFCAPWLGWWLADRDGRALPLALPDPMALHDQVAVVPGWTPAQHDALARLTLTDRLLQPIEPHLRFAPALTTHEARHDVAAKMLALTAQHGYQDSPEQSAWIAWALREGQCPDDGLDTHPVHALQLCGDALWEALMVDTQALPDAAAHPIDRTYAPQKNEGAP